MAMAEKEDTTIEEALLEMETDKASPEQPPEPHVPAQLPGPPDATEPRELTEPPVPSGPTESPEPTGQTEPPEPPDQPPPAPEPAPENVPPSLKITSPSPLHPIEDLEGVRNGNLILKDKL